MKLSDEETSFVDFRSEFYHDAYIRELGESLEDSYAQEDRKTLLELERDLMHALENDHLTLFIRFVDVSRRQMMRAEGHSYIKGYFMGVEAGKILEKHEYER